MNCESHGFLEIDVPVALFDPDHVRGHRQIADADYRAGEFVRVDHRRAVLWLSAAG
jgi:hypothetical protein